jgi:hypothetical protein
MERVASQGQPVLVAPLWAFGEVLSSGGYFSWGRRTIGSQIEESFKHDLSGVTKRSMVDSVGEMGRDFDGEAGGDEAGH